jgi:hypothetical protein
MKRMPLTEFPWEAYIMIKTAATFLSIWRSVLILIFVILFILNPKR